MSGTESPCSPEDGVRGGDPPREAVASAPPGARGWGRREEPQWGRVQPLPGQMGPRASAPPQRGGRGAGTRPCPPRPVCLPAGLSRPRPSSSAGAQIPGQEPRPGAPGCAGPVRTQPDSGEQASPRLSGCPPGPLPLLGAGGTVAALPPARPSPSPPERFSTLPGASTSPSAQRATSPCPTQCPRLSQVRNRPPGARHRVSLKESSPAVGRPPGKC